MINDVDRPLRYEIKMTFDEVYLPQVRAALWLHPAGFVEAYLPRQVNNIYLDSATLACMETHIDGTAERDKLRYRWYGPDDTAVRGMLELKHKAGQLGWKEYGPVAATFDLTAITWREWIDLIRTHAPGTAVYWLSRYDRPTLLNSYRREYYESADGEVRVTLDYEQRVYEQVMYPAPNLVIEAPIAGRAVLEVKAPSTLHRRVSDVLSFLPLQVEQNSKYVNGMLGALDFM
ncbi:MAG: VTC domain-containing protein [Anaerolineae bacterium]